jgi:hypothetical protein
MQSATHLQRSSAIFETDATRKHRRTYRKSIQLAYAEMKDLLSRRARRLAGGSCAPVILRMHSSDKLRSDLVARARRITNRVLIDAPGSLARSHPLYIPANEDPTRESIVISIMRIMEYEESIHHEACARDGGLQLECEHLTAMTCAVSSRKAETAAIKCFDCLFNFEMGMGL